MPDEPSHRPQHTNAEPQSVAGLNAQPTPVEGNASRMRRRLRLVSRRWPGPSWRWLIIYAIVLTLGLVGVLGAGVFGVRAGLTQRAADQATVVAEHYARGLQHIAAGEPRLARAEFQMVLSMQPNHQDALQALASLQSITATPLPTATAAATPAPTPTPETPATPDQRNTLLTEAQGLYDQRDWEGASLRLERLQALDANYEPVTVANLLYKSYFNQGQALVAAGRIEEGIRKFERALAIRPKDAQAQEQKDLATRYLQALGYWQANWQKAVVAFGDLYKLRPDYLDVETRLTGATIAYGDLLAQRNDWCSAVTEYAVALSLQPSAALRTKNDDASKRCVAQGTLPPEPTVAAGPVTPGSTVAPPAGALAAGYIYFATWDPDFNRYVLYRTAVAPNARPQAIATNVRQPTMGPGGTRLAVRNTRGDMIGLATISPNGEFIRRVTTFAEDSMPTWSPDGKEWVFTSNREGDRLWRLYHAWSEGTEAAEYITFGRSPAWYPGQQIALEGCDNQGNNCGLWQMSPDRSRYTPLTNVAGDTAPAWAPGGNRLAFMSAQRSGNWDLFLREANGTVTPLAPSAGIDGLPTWSPDGKWVAFLSNRDGPWALYVVQPRGSPLKIINLPGTLPDWSDERLAWGM